MRRAVTLLGSLVAVSLLPVTAVAAAAPPPAEWVAVSTPSPAGDLATQKVYRHAAVVAGGGAYAVGHTQYVIGSSPQLVALVERWDGISWTAVRVPASASGASTDTLAGVAASSARDVWAVGSARPTYGTLRADPYVVRFNGTSWSKVVVPRPQAGVDASLAAVALGGPRDVWVVGASGGNAAVWHWDGAAWTTAALPRLSGCGPAGTDRFTAVTVNAGVVYAGGTCTSPAGEDIAVVARMTTLASWRVVARVTARSGITDMTSDANGTVWATGTRTVNGVSRVVLVSGSGTTWTKAVRGAPSGVDEQGYGVAVTPAGVVVVGERNTRSVPRAPLIATWTGTAWAADTVAAPDPSATWMAAVAGTAAGPVWAMGQYIGARSVIQGFAAYPA